MSEESYVMVFGEVFSYTQIIKNEKIIEQLKKLLEEKQKELLELPRGHPIGDVPIIKEKLRDGIKELQKILGREK